MGEIQENTFYSDLWLIIFWRSRELQNSIGRNPKLNATLLLVFSDGAWKLVKRQAYIHWLLAFPDSIAYNSLISSLFYYHLLCCFTWGSVKTIWDASELNIKTSELRQIVKASELLQFLRARVVLKLVTSLKVSVLHLSFFSSAFSPCTPLFSNLRLVLDAWASDSGFE